mgnify:CR=1 FL=1
MRFIGFLILLNLEHRHKLTLFGVPPDEDGRTDGRTDGRMDGRLNGRTDGWTDGRMLLSMLVIERCFSACCD